MYIIRRWWTRYALQLILVSVALSAAWAIRQTQGSAIFEVYQAITRPFQSSPTVQAERLNDAWILEMQARLVELESQNQKLQELLGYAAPRPGGIAAPVMGRSATSVKW